MSVLISKTMTAALCEQIANEFAASHNYLAMACTFDDMGLKILSRFFFDQADEERAHAMKIVRYVQEVGGAVEMAAIPLPSGDFSTPQAILAAALESELTVTAQINALVALAQKEQDYAAGSFLNWFVDEQVEEVSTMRDLVQLTERTTDMFQVESRLRHMMQAGERA